MTSRTALLSLGALFLSAGCSATEPALLQLGPTSAGAPERSLRAPSFDAEFWKDWRDGKAELSSYDLLTPRYGELRQGLAIAIFVPESFSQALRVKAEPGLHPQGDEVPVMKLNLAEDFQTGIYDYHLLSSSFLALAPFSGRGAGAPVKISFSSQEWCGSHYHQVLFDERALREEFHSYFDGEADYAGTLPYPPEGLSEDALLLWARGMAAPKLAPGERLPASVLRSLKRARLLHEPLAWQAATLSRAGAPERVTVPAGSFEVEAYRAELEGGYTYTFYTERAAPHRVIKWERSDGERAELVASERLAYWELAGEGGEAYLERLGLSRRPRRTP
jgi:hypothetical protein